MNEEQKRLLDLLTRTAKFMEDNNITWYLYGGSAIGALRHNGFIPWDDDLDIVVDRTNFEKIIACHDRMPWDDIEFISMETNPYYYKPSGFFALKNNFCTSVSRMFYRGPCMGTVMDIFIMDDLREDKKEEMARNLILYDDVLVDVWLYNTKINQLDKEYFQAKAMQEKEGRMTVLKELKARLESCSPEESTMYQTRWSKTKILTYDKDIFGEPKYVDFEGVKMPVPAKPEEMLRVEYGYTWYMLPEKQDWESHGFVVNNNLSANNIAEDLHNFVDWEQAGVDLRARKAETIKALRSRLPKEEIERKIFARVIEHRVSKAVGEILANDNMAYSSIINKLEGLIRNAGLFEFEDASAAIEGKVIEKLSYGLILAGRYYDADKLRVYFSYGYDSKNGQKISQLLDNVINVAIAIQDHKYDQLRGLIDSVPEEIRSVISDCIVGEGRLALLGLDGSKTYEEINELCDKHLVSFPDNYDVMKVKADILKCLGEEENAQKLYDKVLECSRNGLDVLAIKNMRKGK